MRIRLSTDLDSPWKSRFEWIVTQLLGSMGHRIVSASDTNDRTITIWYGISELHIPRYTIKTHFDSSLSEFHDSYQTGIKDQIAYTKFLNALDTSNLEDILPHCDDDATCSFDWITFSFMVLSEEYGYRTGQLDHLGRLTAQSLDHSEWLYSTPIISRIANWISEQIKLLAEKWFNISYSIAPWTEGKLAGVAISHDCDILWKDHFKYLKQYLGFIKRREVSLGHFLKDNVVKASKGFKTYKSKFQNYQLDTVRNYLDNKGITSTFYVMSSTAELKDISYYLDYAKVDLLNISESGHTIGLHGGFESKSYTDLEQFMEEKRKLEDVLSLQIDHTRQHYIGFERDKTWSIHERSGIKTDSSTVFPDIAGFKSGFAAPYQPWNFNSESPYDILEIPLFLMDSTLMHSSYMALGKYEAMDVSRKIIDDILAVNGLITLNWHQRIISGGPFVDWWDVLDELIDYLKTIDVAFFTADLLTDWLRKIKAVDIMLRYDNHLLITTMEDIEDVSIFISTSKQINFDWNYDHELKINQISKSDYKIDILKLNANEEVALNLNMV
ncbi:hypothetical protein K8I28_11145 [bacterium]|nr:hypothetical protein [bacterium]